MGVLDCSWWKFFKCVLQEVGRSLHRLLRYITCSHVQYVFQAFGFKWRSFKPQLADHLCSRRD